VNVCERCDVVFKSSQAAAYCENCGHRPPPSDSGRQLRVDMRSLPASDLSDWTRLARAVCIECGEPFEPTTSDHKLCSGRCKTARSRDGRGGTDELGPGALEYVAYREACGEILDAMRSDNVPHRDI